jgi:hypothetical protein
VAPPGLAATLTSGGTTGAEANGQTERLIRSAHVILDGCGYEMGPRRVHRLVRKFEARVARNGWEFFDFLANAVLMDADQRRRALLDPDVARAISYADPTGEAAVAKVMRAG